MTVKRGSTIRVWRPCTYPFHGGVFDAAADNDVTLDVGMHPALPEAVVLEAEALLLGRVVVTLRCCHLVVVGLHVPLHRLVQLAPGTEGGIKVASHWVLLRGGFTGVALRGISQGSIL